jgi:hypothetical protein
MLHRLFPLPLTIVFYSPEPATRRDGDKLTNWGRERCVGKSRKPVPCTFELHIVLGKLYAVGGSGVHERFFGQKFDSDIQFECGTQKLMHYSGSKL